MTYFDCSLQFDQIKIKCDGTSTYGIAALKIESVSEGRITIYLPGEMADKLERAVKAFNHVMDERPMKEENMISSSV